MNTYPLASLHPTFPHVVVYTKDNCHFCNAVKKRLTAKGVPYVVINVEHVDNGDEIAAALRDDLKVTRMPAVVAHNLYDAPTFFSGPAPDQISLLAHQWAQLGYSELYPVLYEAGSYDPDTWREAATRFTNTPEPVQIYDNFYRLTTDGTRV